MIKIYKLVHPSSSKIYIGQTCRSLKRRLGGHIYESKQHPYLRKSKWIQSLIKKGLKPNIELIEEIADSEADRREAYYIKCGWNDNPNNMLNSPLMPGGEGFKKGKNISQKSRDKSALSRRRFTNEQLIQIAQRINDGEFIKDIANEYGVHRITIVRNLNGSVIGTRKFKKKTWRPFGKSHGMSKITKEVASGIRKEYSTGKHTQKSLALKHGLSQASVWSILKNKTWKQN